MNLKIFVILLCRSVPVDEVEIFFFHYSQSVFEIFCFLTWFPPQDRLDCDSSCHPVDLQDVDATVRITRQMRRDSAILERVNVTRSSRTRNKSKSLLSSDATQMPTNLTANIRNRYRFTIFKYKFYSPTQRGWLSTNHFRYKIPNSF